MSRPTLDYIQLLQKRIAMLERHLSDVRSERDEAMALLAQITREIEAVVHDGRTLVPA